MRFGLPNEYRIMQERKDKMNFKDPMPIISFIVPAYNAELTLNKCIESIVYQEISGCEKEIIVINNNSSDKTNEIALSFPDVKLLFLEKKSRSRARQLGISTSKGDFIAFVDSDVVLDKAWTQTLFSGLKKYPQVGATQGSIIPVISSTWHWIRWHRSRVRTFGTFIHLSALVSGSIPVINTAASLWRRRALGDGFDLSLERAEDIDLTYSVINKGYALFGTSKASATVEWSTGIYSWFKRFYEQGKFEKVVYAKWGVENKSIKVGNIFGHPLWNSLPLYAQISDLITISLFKLGTMVTNEVVTAAPSISEESIQSLFKTFKNDLFFLTTNCRAIFIENKIGIFNLKSKRCIWVSDDESEWPIHLTSTLIKDGFIIKRD